MSALPRGTCPVCRADVALRKSGLVREHEDHRDALHGTSGGPTGTYVVPTCPGSGQPVDDERAHHAR